MKIAYLSHNDALQGICPGCLFRCGVHLSSTKVTFHVLPDRFHWVACPSEGRRGGEGSKQAHEATVCHTCHKSQEIRSFFFGGVIMIVIALTATFSCSHCMLVGVIAELWPSFLIGGYLVDADPEGCYLRRQELGKRWCKTSQSQSTCIENRVPFYCNTSLYLLSGPVFAPASERLCDVASYGSQWSYPIQVQYQ